MYKQQCHLHDLSCWVHRVSLGVQLLRYFIFADLVPCTLEIFQPLSIDDNVKNSKHDVIITSKDTSNCTPLAVYVVKITRTLWESSSCQRHLHGHCTALHFFKNFPLHVLVWSVSQDHNSLPTVCRGNSFSVQSRSIP